jgi:hypothetical protein
MADEELWDDVQHDIALGFGILGLLYLLCWLPLKLAFKAVRFLGLALYYLVLGLVDLFTWPWRENPLR